uniref:Uncharacterized protein n=1 Tax=Micrurus lemniscatus lemniscatus TaxID=129467 RepID=A0A2D4IK30_MICLE
MPVEVVVTHTLNFRVNSIVAALADHSMILHITGFADGLFINHDVDLSSQDTVAIKAAEMLQMPVLTFSFCVLIVENKLITTSTARFFTVTVVSATIEFSIFPEIDHIYQEFTAGAADKASRMPEFVISSSLSIHSWVTFFHILIAPETEILRSFLTSLFVFHGSNSSGGSFLAITQDILLPGFPFHFTGKFDITHTQCFSLVFLHKLLHLLNLIRCQLVAFGRVLIMSRQLLGQLFLAVLSPFRASHRLFLLWKHLHIVPRQGLILNRRCPFVSYCIDGHILLGCHRISQYHYITLIHGDTI